MSDALLLGIDLGAGSLKSTVIAADGEVVASAASPVRTLSPRPGHSEQDPGDWWSAVVSSLRKIADGGVDLHRVGGVSVTAGAHTHVLEDGEGNILRPAIMWNDQRSGEQVARERAANGARILELSGNRISATWTLPQLMWVREEEPEIHARIRRLLPAKDWLRRKLDREPRDRPGRMPPVSCWPMPTAAHGRPSFARWPGFRPTPCRPSSRPPP